MTKKLNREDLKKKLEDIKLPSNKRFGFFLTGVSALLTAYFFWMYIGFWGWFFMSFTSITLLVTLINSNLLLPLNKSWMWLGLILSMIVNPIIMGVIFFLLFVPIGFVLRILGRDELQLKKRVTSSYWKERSPIGPEPSSFKNQF